MANTFCPSFCCAISCEGFIADSFKIFLEEKPSLLHSFMLAKATLS